MAVKEGVYVYANEKNSFKLAEYHNGKKRTLNNSDDQNHVHSPSHSRFGREDEPDEYFDALSNCVQKMFS